MKYDPLIEILNVAENALDHPGKSAALRNLQTVLRVDPSLSKELQKRMAAALHDVSQSRKEGPGKGTCVPAEHRCLLQAGEVPAD